MNQALLTVLDEVTSDEIDKAHVERRVEDWEKRIDDLYREILGWLPPEWAEWGRRTVAMHEPMMRAHGVPTRQLPVLLLSAPGHAQARLEPRGLWIVGSNGRVDLRRDGAHFVMNDRSEIFESARWDIAPFVDRGRIEPLTRRRFLEALVS